MFVPHRKHIYGSARPVTGTDLPPGLYRVGLPGKYLLLNVDCPLQSSYEKLAVS
jgi:hypothetical protein